MQYTGGVKKMQRTPTVVHLRCKKEEVKRWGPGWDHRRCIRTLFSPLPYSPHTQLFYTEGDRRCIALPTLCFAPLFFGPVLAMPLLLPSSMVTCGALQSTTNNTCTCVRFSPPFHFFFTRGVACPAVQVKKMQRTQCTMHRKSPSKMEEGAKVHCVLLTISFLRCIPGWDQVQSKA